MKNAMRLGLMPGFLGALSTSAIAGDKALFFDDFNYPDKASMVKSGWTLRGVKGWPGIPGARWGESAIELLPDTAKAGNRFVRMIALTDGTSEGTMQAQLCQARKYFEGTYAARIRFSDKAAYGSSKDQLVMSFYTSSPYVKDFDPNYSELDFEYLPTGGWGANGAAMFNTSWETFQLEPWDARNQSGHVAGSLGGWHTLVMQVSGGKVNYYVDGKKFAEHGGKNYPRLAMSFNFNLWFIKDGISTDKNPRVWHEDIDWVLHVKDQVLTPAEVESQVAELQKSGTTLTDTVPAMNPPLPCPCNF
jgi:hypothetical protein